MRTAISHFRLLLRTRGALRRLLAAVVLALGLAHGGIAFAVVIQAAGPLTCCGQRGRCPMHKQGCPPAADNHCACGMTAPGEPAPIAQIGFVQPAVLADGPVIPGPRALAEPPHLRTHYSAAVRAVPRPPPRG